MRVVICDGNRILCEALAAALEACDHELTAVPTVTADACIAAIIRDEAEVCLLDPQLRGSGDSLEVIRAIRRRCPDTAVVIISDLSETLTGAQARELGIAAVIGKNRSVSQIAQLLHAMPDGQPAFDQVPRNGSARPVTPFMLTPRETDVLRRIAAGQHSQHMAADMNISVSTLRTYVKNVFTKLGVHSRLEAAAVASRAGLLSDASPTPPLPAPDQRKMVNSA